MATGYTEAIMNDISFEDFVMRCSRAMGALIAMRDQSLDAKIPDKFEPSTYHLEKMENANKELERLRSMSPEEAEAAAQSEFDETISSHQKVMASNNERRKKYKTMLQKVKSWQPPTQEHVGLKDFMIEQITSSIDFDCGNHHYIDNPPKRLTGQEWLSQQIAIQLRNIDCHTLENQKEIERANERTEWIQQLRNSLSA